MTGERLALGLRSEPGGLLRRLSELDGVSGREDAVAAAVGEHMEAACGRVSVDALGNVLGLREGEGPPPRPRVLLAAHMDEIGLAVTRIEAGGFLRVAPVGGSDPRNLLGQEVWVYGRRRLSGYLGARPPHLTRAEERTRVIPTEDLFVDVGLPEATVRSEVRPGDAIALRRACRPLQGSRYTGKALDNRAGVTAVLLALELLEGLRCGADVLAAATVQEEVGLRGALTSAYGALPDAALAIDVTFATGPGLPEDRTVEMGKGPSVALGPNMHPQVSARLLEVARADGIPYQVEVLPGPSGTDAWALQVARSGVPTGLVSIPLRYMHSAAEVVDLEDVVLTARLLARFCAALTGEEAGGWKGRALG